LRSAIEAGIIAAAALPCTNRAATSDGMFGARPQAKGGDCLSGD
jgi:hypothetical protein